MILRDEGYKEQLLPITNRRYRWRFCQAVGIDRGPSLAILCQRQKRKITVSCPISAGRRCLTSQGSKWYHAQRECTNDNKGRWAGRASLLAHLPKPLTLAYIEGQRCEVKLRLRVAPKDSGISTGTPVGENSRTSLTASLYAHAST